MATEHAIVTHKEGSVTLKPASPGAKTKVNGLALTDELTLKHHDRIVFGNYFFIFQFFFCMMKFSFLPN